MDTASAGRDRWLRGWLIVAVILGIIARVYALGRLPGINGDEAWYGAGLQAMMSGQQVFWWTPSGNPLNPFHSGGLYLLLQVFPPSLAMLRVPAVLLSIATLVVAYPLFRASIGTSSARLLTLLLATSPVGIAFGRFGWDPSGTPFINLIALGLALADKPILAALATVAAVVIHPTNVFFFPIFAAAWAPHAWRRYSSADSAARTRAWIGAVLAGAIAIVAAGIVLRTAASNPATSLPPIAVVLDRMASPAAWFEVLRGVNRLFVGVTTATFVAGEPRRAVVIAAELLGVVALAPLLLIRRRAGDRHLMLLAGIGVSLLLFMAAGGPRALQPGFERYALFFLTPILVVVAIGADALPAPARRGFAIVIPAGMLALVVTMYFAPLIGHGGHAHPTFRTGLVEPKRAAFEFVRTQSPDGATIICEDWWLYWPVRFLAGGDPRFVVSLAADAVLPPSVRDQITRHDPTAAPVPAYAIVFEGSARAGLPGIPPSFTAVDPRGRAILHVVRVK